MLYSTMLFLHILGTLIMFIAVGLTITSIIAMLHTTDVTMLKMWSTLAVRMDGLLPVSVIVIFFPALYLVISTWGWRVTWINVCLVVLAMMMVIGPTMVLTRLKKIAKAIHAETGQVASRDLQQTIRNRTLLHFGFTMAALGIGIVFIMTVKVALIGCIITFIVTIFIGLLVSTIILRKAPTISSI